jgi:hypothetical protein
VFHTLSALRGNGGWQASLGFCPLTRRLGACAPILKRLNTRTGCIPTKKPFLYYGFWFSLFIGFSRAETIMLTLADVAVTPGAALLGGYVCLSCPWYLASPSSRSQPTTRGPNHVLLTDRLPPPPCKLPSTTGFPGFELLGRSVEQSAPAVPPGRCVLGFVECPWDSPTTRDDTLRSRTSYGALRAHLGWATLLNASDTCLPFPPPKQLGFLQVPSSAHVSGCLVQGVSITTRLSRYSFESSF